MRSLICALALLLCASTAQGQELVLKPHLLLSGGTSVPTSQLASGKWGPGYNLGGGLELSLTRYSAFRLETNYSTFAPRAQEQVAARSLDVMAGLKMTASVSWQARPYTLISGGYISQYYAGAQEDVQTLNGRVAAGVETYVAPSLGLYLEMAFVNVEKGTGGTGYAPMKAGVKLRHP